MIETHGRDTGRPLPSVRMPSRAACLARAALAVGCLAAAAGDATRAAVEAAKATVTTSRGEYQILVFAPPHPDPARPLVLIISGEGGWRRFDDLITGFLNDAGYWVGGLDITKYFWDPQDDRQALAADIRAYAAALARTAGRKPDAPIVLAGFSFGADLAPWVAGAGGWDERLRGLLMIGPDKTGSLHFRITEMLGFEPTDHIFSVAEALASVKGRLPIAFVHGEKDSHSAAPLLEPQTGEPKKMLVVAGADHHFSGQEQKLKAALIEGLEWIAPPEKHE